MTICKCGRNIPDGAICFCSYSSSGTPVTIYTNEKIEIPSITNVINTSVLSESSTLDFTRSLWKALHTYKYVNETETKRWFDEWLKRVPCGECKEHSKLILENNPMDFSNKKAFFESGVKFHNLVNDRLGKLNVSIEEALNIWNN
jgi:hypothetical protein